MSATNRGAPRIASDYYPTPISAFDPLLPYLDRDRAIFEPASGDGRLVDRLKQAKFTAFGNDLKHGYDFLRDKLMYQCIVTNPPYSKALEFCQHAIAHADEVFMLLRLNFLGSQARKAWWQSHEPAALFVLSKRPSFVKGATDACEYAWFMWANAPRHTGIFHL